jgi:hypothetical protein
MPSLKRTTPAAAQPIAIFGDVDLGIWGLLIDAEQPRLAIAALDADPAEIRLEPANVDRDDDEVWSVTSPDHSLRLERGQATTLTPGGDRRLQPLRVTGTAALGGEQVEIDVAGVLTDSGLGSGAGADSLRLFGSWFPAGHQIVLRAERPRGAKGQDHDVIDVVALGENEALVFDPRLSTTYDASSTPRQAGLELWIGADEEGDQYPRRVSGVATGSSISDSNDGATLNAAALQCLSRGETGVGVYVLIRAA